MSPEFSGEDVYPVTLRKRKSPEDYLDGYLAGLKEAQAVISRFIQTTEETKRISEQPPPS